MAKRNDFSTVSPETVLGGPYSPKLVAASPGSQGVWVGWLEEGQVSWQTSAAAVGLKAMPRLYDEQGFMVEF